MKINKKKLAMFGLPILAIGVVSALVMYFTIFSVTITVDQPISITYDTETISGYVNIVEPVDCDAGDSCIGKLITIHNDGDSAISLIISSIMDEGMSVKYVNTLYDEIGEEISVPANDFILFFVEYSPDKYLPSGSQITVETKIA